MRKCYSIHILFLLYIICIIFIIFGYRNLYQNSFNLNPIYGFTILFQEFSYNIWKEFIVNVLLYIPIGIYLGFILKESGYTYNIIIFSLIISLCIEILQLITHKGVFDINDILYNILGSVLGFIFYKILINIKNKELNKKYFLTILIILLIILLPIIVAFFQRNKIGNIVGYGHANFKNSIVFNKNDELILSDKQSVDILYKSEKRTNKQKDEFASNFFKLLNQTPDNSQTLHYEDVTVYYSKDHTTCLWVYNENSRYWYIQSDKKTSKSINYTDFISDTIYFEYPQFNNIFEKTNFGFKIMEKNNALYFGGDITIDENDIANEIKCNIIKATSDREIQIKSEQDAFDDLKKGEYYLKETNISGNILIQSVDLDYILDNKGYIQPVYIFIGTDISKSKQIEFIVPAINSI